MRGLEIVILGALVVPFVLLSVSSAAGQTFSEFPLPTPQAGPAGITAGSDGNVWFTEYRVPGTKIGRITPEGVITEFTIRSPFAHPLGITPGPDGALWFTENRGPNQIARITTSGEITEFGSLGEEANPNGIVTGPDGALWFTEEFGNQIGRITTAGSITEFPLPGFAGPGNIVLGPDGALWFTEQYANRIGRITTSGTITEFPIPTPDSYPDCSSGGPCGPISIAAGADGALWFTENTENKIGRITTSGQITEFPIPTPGSAPYGIVAGPDGNLYFTERRGNKIGRITTSGEITEFPVPTPASNPQGITLGPDGAIWFTEQAVDKIGRLSLGPLTEPGPVSVTLPAAASLHGAPPTFFHSDVSVFNPSATQTATVTARYRCFTGACGSAVQTFTVASRQLRVFDDIVGTLFGAAETGGAVEFTGNVLVDSRLYTPSRPAPTVGMYVPGLSPGEAYAEAILTSLSYSANLSTGFRTNVGVYNGNDAAQTVTFTLYNPQGVQIGQTSQVIAARTPFQINNIAGFVGITTDVPSFYCVVRGDGTSKLYVYAAVLDNQSQDLIFVKGANNAAVPASLVTLPAAASLHGAPPTFFHSDVSVFNPSATQPVTVTARYRCFTGACGNAVQTFAVPPRQMQVFNDVVGTLFGAAETGGAVEFSGNVLVDSRLYTPSRPAPTVGMYVPGLSPGEAYAEAVLTSLSFSANLSTGFRTNVGVYNGNDVAQTVTFTLYNPQGLPIGQTSQVIPARTPLQLNNVAGFVGITTDVPSFYCVVRGDGTSKNYVYAAVLDNQSQDLIFVKGAESRPP